MTPAGASPRAHILKLWGPRSPTRTSPPIFLRPYSNLSPAYAGIQDSLKMLENIHRFSLENLEEQEMFWVCSMPCPLHRILKYRSLSTDHRI